MVAGVFFPFMKRLLLHLTVACLAILASFTSCGEDRTGEYYALIRTKTWMYQTMQNYYLFYEDLPAESELDFFMTPQEFLNAAASEKDKKNGVVYSHVDSIKTTASTRSLSENPTYGYEAVMLKAPNGDYALQVLYTQPNSPAEEAGLKRGDIIIGADSIKIGSSDYGKYVSHPTTAHTFTLGTYNAELAKMDTTGTLQMPAPRIIEIQNLLKTSLIRSGNRTAAYILYNEFGQNDITQWQSLYSQLASTQPDDIILDLRYNPGGYVSTAQTVCTLLAPSSAMGQPMLYMTPNDKIGTVESYNFDATLLPGGSSLSYQNLYILTSGNTASASEIIINCLRPYRTGNLYQVGSATFGKNVAQALYTDEQEPLLELWLTTYYLSNADGYKDYDAEGLQPDFNLSEIYGSALGELGSENDLLMQPVLIHMATGAFPSNPETPATRAGLHATDMKVVRNSIDEKPHNTRTDRQPYCISDQN